ncbi:MAG: hypothetical protein COS99_06870 [Candidatus Omnitrophica bacterium CG07_land_8_20_14_0_80_42_15]|uniref:Organic solvent tolerance-like N-terminal domain-containing protein n=1 Tax=Candidatus Aquitaenariimonas noxiae TaxID=1974741 RepID=A0A2J0KYZ7_9BACT|nr:MAG: hypothetical protein COS99_06870 [Candidatus Omnitrophica bacterium CG07_land_8_20_14_0_80_42_15]
MINIKPKIFILLTLCFSFVSNIYAEEAKPELLVGAKPRVPVVVNGDRVEYLQDEQKVVGIGNIDITYGDVKLTCDKITVYLDSKDSLAEGNVKIYQGDDVLSGDKANYNFETKKGQVINADVDAKQWYGRGELVQKNGAIEHRVEKGYVTSCDHVPPHYRLQAKEVVMFLNDRIVAKNCFMYLGKVPVLYIPYYVHPLSEDKPRVTITPGHDKRWGFFALTAWRYYINEQIKGNIHLDYREKDDFAWGFDSKYDTKYIGEGLLQTYYMNKKTIPVDSIWNRDRDITENERYKIQLRHRWQIDRQTDVKVEYYKSSDSTFNKDFFYRQYERDEVMPTYVSALHKDSLYNAEFRMDSRVNEYETVLERLPEADLDVGKNRLMETNFYYKSDNKFSNLNQTFANNAFDNLDVVRYDTYDEISYLARLFGFFNIAPFIGTRQTYFSEDKKEEEHVVRGIFYTGADSSMRFYKVFDYDTNFMGLDINKLRHVINPVVKYYYNTMPTILPQDLRQFDSLDSIDHREGVRFEIENKLQTKRKVSGQMTSIDLARFVVTTDYLLRAEENNELTDIDSQLEIKPYRWLYFETDAKYDPHAAKFKRRNWDLIAQDPTPAEKWQLGIGHRYEAEHSSQLTADVRYKLTPKWQVRAYERYQFKENDLKEQEYSIIRDLHCWTVELIYNIYRPEGETIWLVFRLKALPAVPLEVNTSYHQPKTTSQTFTPLP